MSLSGTDILVHVRMAMLAAILPEFSDIFGFAANTGVEIGPKVSCRYSERIERVNGGDESPYLQYSTS